MSKKTEWYDRELIRAKSHLRDATKFAQLGIKENNYLKDRIKHLEAQLKTPVYTLSLDNDSYVRDLCKPVIEDGPPLRERIFDQLEYELEKCQESDEHDTTYLLRLALFIYMQQNS